LSWYNSGINLIRYLTWNPTGTTVFGSSLQGRVVSWNVYDSTVVNSKSYSLGGSAENHTGVLAMSSSQNPHANFYIDPVTNLFVTTGPLLSEENFGRCLGFSAGVLTEFP
jgi:hypothetical protein